MAEGRTSLTLGLLFWVPVKPSVLPVGSPVEAAVTVAVAMVFCLVDTVVVSLAGDGGPRLEGSLVSIGVGLSLSIEVLVVDILGGSVGEA